MMKKPAVQNLPFRTKRARATTSALTSSALASMLIFSAACGGDSDANPVDAGRTIDATPPVDAAPPDAEPVRCDQLHPLPLDSSRLTTLTGFSQSEDFAFDADGNMVSVEPGAIRRQPKTGVPSYLAGNFNDSAGTAFLADGDLMLNDVGAESLVRIANDGSPTTVRGGISYPNGIAVSAEGKVYVADQNNGTVLEINPDDGDDFAMIATGLFNPNGLSFSPDYQTLYVGSFYGGTVHRIVSDGAGGWNAPVLHGEIASEDKGGGDPGGGLDGVAVDGCGNVYITEYIFGKIWRLAPEGGAPELVIDLPSEWIPNLHWGPGIGGWEKDRLYVADRDAGRVFEIDLGVTEKPTVYP